jgi:hypothetical protein
VGNDNWTLLLEMRKFVEGFYKKFNKSIYFLTIISSIFFWSKHLNDWKINIESQWPIAEKSIPSWVNPSNLKYLENNTDTPILIKREVKVVETVDKTVEETDEISTWDLLDVNTEISKQNFLNAFWNWLWTEACFLIDSIYWWWKWLFLDTIRAIAISEWELKFWIRSYDMNSWNNISTFQINGKSGKEAEMNYSKFYLIWIKFIKDNLKLDIPKNFVKWSINISQEELISYIWYLKNRSLVKNEDLFYLLSNMSPSDKGFSRFISTTVQWWIREIWENVVELLNWEWRIELQSERL